jgi:DegV family protein with EDD domain
MIATSQGETAQVAIVTDSTADLPPAIAEQLHIHVIPNIIMINGESMRDGIDLSRELFYQTLPGMQALPTTGTASPGAYEQLYDRLLQGGFRQVLSLHPSELLSGILNAANTAAHAFRGQVKVIDSQFVSLGLGFQVMAAAEAARAGLPLNELVAIAAHVRQRIRLVAMLDTLEYLRRSGRVSWARAQLGALLRIKPFIELRGGSVLRLGEARTFQKGFERLKSLIQNLGLIKRLAILHTNAEEQAERLRSELGNQAPMDTLIVNVTTVIGVHVGPHGLGFTAVIE